MNCKVGDLVILVRCGNKTMTHYLGSIRLVVASSVVNTGAWYLDPPVLGGNGLTASWYDEDLKPIRDTPGEDETLQWAPVPGERVAA